MLEWRVKRTDIHATQTILYQWHTLISNRSFVSVDHLLDYKSIPYVQGHEKIMEIRRQLNNATFAKKDAPGVSAKWI